MKNESKPTWKDVVKEASQGFDPKKNPNPGHEDVQGMLLELRKITDMRFWRGIIMPRKNSWTILRNSQ